MTKITHCVQALSWLLTLGDMTKDTGPQGSLHAAVAMGRRLTAHQLPALLVWPYDCTRRCNELVAVPIGPNVAEEMTRNLREPFRSRLREQWS